MVEFCLKKLSTRFESPSSCIKDIFNLAEHVKKHWVWHAKHSYTRCYSILKANQCMYVQQQASIESIRFLRCLQRTRCTINVSTTFNLAKLHNITQRNGSRRKKFRSMTWMNCTQWLQPQICHKDISSQRSAGLDLS